MSTSERGLPSHERILVPSRLEELDALVDRTEAFVSRYETDEDRAYTAVLLASEAITNAIEHGNALDESKTVTIDMWAREGRVEIWVEDEGEGFDRASIPDPLAGTHIFEDGGRGIYLIEELADEVRYEAGGRRIGIFFAISSG